MKKQVKKNNPSGLGELLTEVVGWVGVGLILLGYILVSLGEIDGQSPIYLTINLFGAVGIGVDAFSDRNLQPVVLNIIWGVVAVIGLIRFFS